MDDMKKLIERYKKELMDMSKSRPAPAPEPRAEKKRTPQVIGYVDEGAQIDEIFSRLAENPPQSDSTKQVSTEQVSEETESVPEEPETIPDFPKVPDIDDEDDAFGSIPDDFAAPEEKAAEPEVKAIEPELEEGFVAVRDEGELPVIPEDTFDEEDSR